MRWRTGSLARTRRNTQKTTNARMPTFIPGDDEDVIGAAALKCFAPFVSQISAFADEHGIEEAGLLLGPRR